MGSQIIDRLIWIAIKLYNRTYIKLPPLIFDIETRTNPPRVWLVAKIPRVSSTPFLMAYTIGVIATFLVTPKILMQMLDVTSKTSMRVLTTSLTILHFVCVHYVLESNRTLWRNWHCIPFVNLMINNRLSYRTFTWVGSARVHPY